MTNDHRPTLMALLKRETHILHTGLEGLPFFPALAEGSLPLAAYVNQLRALATVFGTFEHQLADSDEPALQVLQGYSESRFSHLLRDLGCFGSQMIPEVTTVKHTADDMAARIRLLSVEKPVALLGYAYVLHGTILGNRVHLPDVQKTFNLTGTGGASFYTGYGDQTDEQWAGFASLVNTAGEAGADTGVILAAAQEAFRLLHAIHAALFPLPSDADLNYFATSLNPEAGNHAVPADERGIRAAMAAAQTCREAYPYFDVRYGERGKRFADSDAAWLAALVELPPSDIITQVAWLGVVLASRGMPRITLEHQLSCLHEELIAADPDRQRKYDRLLAAITWLRNERIRQIPEKTAAELAEAFTAAIGLELAGTLRGTGMLIVSAVCDEKAGITEAVSSIEPWLTDSNRFPAGWIAAVRDTIAEAREMAA